MIRITYSRPYWRCYSDYQNNLVVTAAVIKYTTSHKPGLSFKTTREETKDFSFSISANIMDWCVRHGRESVTRELQGAIFYLGQDIKDFYLKGGSGWKA